MDFLFLLDRTFRKNGFVLVQYKGITTEKKSATI